MKIKATKIKFKLYEENEVNKIDFIFIFQLYCPVLSTSSNIIEK